ncbi:hypothetical protein BS78_07G080800 [Paspalum vaginatum]|nr:hypothetical protein BS78_07G080800 [Paspalum vaginatum]
MKRATSTTAGRATGSVGRRGESVEVEPIPTTHNGPIEEATSSTGSRRVESVEPKAALPQNDLTEKIGRRGQATESVEARPELGVPIEKADGSSGSRHKAEPSTEPPPTQNDPIEKAATEPPTATTTTPEDPIQKTTTSATPTQNGPTDKEVQEFVAEIDRLEKNEYAGLEAAEPKHDNKTKMHRCPQAIRDDRRLREPYTVPKTVAIGPYHRGHGRLVEAEKKKHLAAYAYARKHGPSPKEVYDGVARATAGARGLYDDDVVAGIGHHEFRQMLFYDACFLVQYMFWRTDGHRHKVEPSLESFFRSNHNAVGRDVLLLENQLPWQVVEAVLSMGFRPAPFVEDFLAPWKAYLQGGGGQIRHQKHPFFLDSSCNPPPPHLLGLLRSYIVGRITSSNAAEQQRSQGQGGRASSSSSSSASYSLSDLKKFGITLTPNDPAETELIRMGLNEKGVLSMVPLALDDARASFLVNMAALELCMMNSPFQEAVQEEDSIVCSYLLLLANLVHEVEDVRQLKAEYKIVQGAGVVYEDALEFFTSLRRCLSMPLPRPSPYARIMEEIAEYRRKRELLFKAREYAKENKKKIVAVFSAITVILGIIGSLVGILTMLKSNKG